MSFAVQQDITDRYGQDVLPVDENDQIDTQSVSQALSDASDEITALLNGLDAPANVKQLCVDIAIYRLSNDAGSLTDDRRKRYEDVISFLKYLVPSSSVSTSSASGSGGEQTVHSESKNRQFNRESMT